VLEPFHRLAVLLAVLAACTAATIYCCRRDLRIPNALTLPMFVGGFAYQGVFGGLAGLGDGVLGFLVAFGLMFALYLVAEVGAGAAKLWSALGVWLGPWLTLQALPVFVLLMAITAAAVRWVERRDRRALTDAQLAMGPVRPQSMLVELATPTALATWGVVAWNWPVLF
jgi:Flp pilus assembly protein protease CpaA